MSTSTVAITSAHTVAYVNDKMLLSLLKIINWSGLDPQKFTADWEVLENGIKTWIMSGHFIAAVLEIYDPSKPKQLIGRWDLNLDYDNQEDEMWTDIDAIKYSIAKSGLLPSGCGYSIIIRTKSGKPSVQGWSSTELRSTNGFSQFSIGTTIGAGTLSSQASYWRENT